MQEAFIVAVVFSVPLAAILGGYWVRVKRIELESGGPARELDARLRALEAENRELRSRVETLETIATSDAPRSRVRVTAAEPSRQHEHEHEIPTASAQQSSRRQG